MPAEIAAAFGSVFHLGHHHRESSPVAEVTPAQKAEMALQSYIHTKPVTTAYLPDGSLPPSRIVREVTNLSDPDDPANRPKSQGTDFTL